MRAGSRGGVALGAVVGLVVGLVFSGCTKGSSSGGGFAVAPVSSSTSPVSSTTSPTAPQPTAPLNLHTGPELVLDATGQSGFYGMPFPSDARRLPGGGPDLTGCPNPNGMWFVNEMVDLCEHQTLGASPSGPIYFQFNAPINPPVDDPVGSVQPGASIFLVDVDPNSAFRLERNPIHTALVTTADSCRPANLLEILPVPGRDLRPRTTYAAVVLRSFGAPGAPFLGQNAALTSLLSGTAPVGSYGVALQQTFDPLASALNGLGISPVDIAAATVFTTGDPAATLIQQTAYVDALPPIAPTMIGVRDQYPGFTALVGTYQVPQYQAGVPPFILTGGNEVTDAQGNPVPQRYDSVEFCVSIPAGKMPAKGFPLYFYIHGTGGLAGEAIDRGVETQKDVPSAPGTGIASWVAPHGWATSCAAGPLSPGRIGNLSGGGYIAYNFFNPVAMRDNFVQMVLEMTHLRRMLMSLQIDPTLCPGCDVSASSTGKIYFDPDLTIVGGQSLGSYLAGMCASTLAGWKGAVLSGAGGSWIEFPFGPSVPLEPASIVNDLALPAGESVDIYHPFIMMADLALGPADNTHLLRHVYREPLPGHVPPHMLVVEGNPDHQVPEVLQRALILALGIDLAGPEVGAAPDGQDLPVLAISGRSELPYPVQSNLTLATGDTRTAAFVRYVEDPVTQDGHYVFFQETAPEQQMLDFLDALVAGTAPVIQKH